MLNGKGPYRFILDTGGHDILTPEAAKAIGLKPEGAGATGGAGAGTLPEQFARVDTLQIGGVKIRNQPFFVIPLQYDTVEDDPRPPLAGLLGLELFERMAIHLDYGGPRRSHSSRSRPIGIRGREPPCRSGFMTTFQSSTPNWTGIPGRSPSIPAIPERSWCSISGLTGSASASR